MNEIKINDYLAKFGDISKLDRKILLKEMDDLWDSLNLNNKRPIIDQSDMVARFYSHPVWILNGIYSEADSISKSHRNSIAEFVKSLNINKIADYGGGSGVLAKFIAEKNSDAIVHIIEPFPSSYFIDRLKNYNRVLFVPQIEQTYDLIIAQDVLEHIDNPIELVLKLINSVNLGGYLIFANCFYPDIKCHLPSTFYLRHTFKYVMKHSGCEFVTRISGAQHALVFKKTNAFDKKSFYKSNKKALFIGSFINFLSSIAFKIRQLLR